MIDLFADIPEKIITQTLEMIRKNLHKVELYGGHTLYKHTDVQLLSLQTRLKKEDICFATSFWDVEIAAAVAQGIMRRYFETEISDWLKNSCNDLLPLRGRFQKTIGYGFKKGEHQLREDLQKACLVLRKDKNADWGFRILTSYPIF